MAQRDLTRVLIVEDEKIIAADLEESLTEMGYDVCGVTASGEEALQMGREFDPDVVMMDIKLEGDLDGIETARYMKQLMNLPVVFLSAFSDDEILTRAEKTEPFGFLVKPFQPQELSATIRMASYKAMKDQKLLEANHQLKRELTEVKTLNGMLPICAGCKKIRDKDDYWHELERYITDNSEATFTHSICPDCIDKYYK